MTNKKYNAFTMAEVLVTLLIIGIIAAVTLPGLKESTDKTGNVALAKKAYGAASNAFAQLQATYGPTLYWLAPQGAPAPNERVINPKHPSNLIWMFRSKMNVVKSSLSRSDDMFTLSGNKFDKDSKIDDKLSINLAGVFQTADGMYWAFSAPNSYCSDDLCALIMVDTNGPKKPNRMGVDLFIFDITTQGVLPHKGNDCADMNGNGYSCSDVILSGNDAALDFIYE